MSKLILSLSVILAAGLSHAATLADVQQALDGQAGHKMHDCMVKSWEATKPTDDQNTKLHEIMTNVTNIYQSHKTAIENAGHDLMTAWQKYPISRDQVVIAEALFNDQIKPVREAMRDGQIDSLNLLSGDQRSTFDTTFMACMKAP